MVATLSSPNMISNVKHTIYDLLLLSLSMCSKHCKLQDGVAYDTLFIDLLLIIKLQIKIVVKDSTLHMRVQSTRKDLSKYGVKFEKLHIIKITVHLASRQG